MPTIRSVLASLKKADETFALIDPGDVIAIGVSGGKDSLCLLYAMHLYTKFSKKDFRIVPITLDLGFPGFDTRGVADYCASLGYELIVNDAKEVYPILLEHTKPGHHVPCSICSRMKKAAINDVAKKHGCNKVAFAHHRDDALETLFMNMIHGGSISTFEPKMRLDRAGIDFIRPFIFVEEAQLLALAQEENLPVLGKTCPADGYTERQYCKDLLHSLYLARPEAKANFASMLYDYESFRLYFEHIEYPNPLNPRLTLKPLLNAKDAIIYINQGHALPSEAETFFIRKDHQNKGHVSFRYDNPHQISILSVAYDGDKEEGRSALLHFEAFFSRKINPLVYVYSDEDLSFSLGYRQGEPSFGQAYVKRYAR